MSVNSLATTTVNIYYPVNSISVYGTNQKTYTLLEADVNARVQYKGGIETIINGKEKIISDHEIYIDKKYATLTIGHIIIDNETGNQFDIMAIKTLYKGTHIQIYAKQVKDIIVFTINP